MCCAVLSCANVVVWWCSDDEPDPVAVRAARRRERAAATDVWVPYKQTNGVAVYEHKAHDEATGMGGEVHTLPLVVAVAMVTSLAAPVCFAGSVFWFV